MIIGAKTTSSHTVRLNILEVFRVSTTSIVIHHEVVTGRYLINTASGPVPSFHHSVEGHSHTLITCTRLYFLHPIQVKQRSRAATVDLMGGYFFRAWFCQISDWYRAILKSTVTDLRNLIDVMYCVITKSILF